MKSTAAGWMVVPTNDRAKFPPTDMQQRTWNAADEKLEEFPGGADRK
jgi:hypothetical protein